MDELDRIMPTIVFAAKDKQGRDVSVVRVTMDGAPLVAKLDGTAVAVDPGEHDFTFEANGEPPVTQHFVIREGEKSRRETIAIGGLPPAPVATLSVVAGEGDSVAVDGKTVGVDRWTGPLVPGPHDVTVIHPGKKSYRTSVRPTARRSPQDRGHAGERADARRSADLVVDRRWRGARGRCGGWRVLLVSRRGAAGDAAGRRAGLRDAVVRRTGALLMVTRLSIGRWVLLVVAGLMVTCARQGPDVGGLMLEIINDGSLTIDIVHVEIRTTGADAKVVLQRDYKIPQEKTLPNTIGIASDGRPTTTVSINVSAYHLNAGTRIPVDRRDHLVTQIPADRVVGLPLVLAATCTPHVKADAQTGDAVSDCGSDTTCSPTTGQCVPSAIDASRDLKPYTPGEESLPPSNPSRCESSATCDVLPAATCADPVTRRTYRSSGTCTNGTCNYPPTNTPCGANEKCSGGVCSCPSGQCTPVHSCEGLAATCGPAGNEDCCAWSVVTGGTYDRSNDVGFPATVSDFRLDTFEITVGRFRKFAAAYTKTMIPANAGKNPNNPSDPGWDKAWDASLPASAGALMAALKCPGTPAAQTWTDAAAGNENRPVNCITWFEAQAFCIWDRGGRLPTEAEWNYAAAGGSEQRVYPWSSPPAATTISDAQAVYCGGSCAGPQDVGSKSPAGNGRYGQANMAGNVWEWVQDWHHQPYSSAGCTDCADLTPAIGRVLRGGSFNNAAGGSLQAQNRNLDQPARRNVDSGARCARTP